MQMLTERVDSTLEEIMIADSQEYVHLIASLNDHEKRLFEELVTKLRSGEFGDIDILENFWKVDYVRRPPSIEEFITEPDRLKTTRVSSLAGVTFF
jgi:ribosomal protein S18